MSNPLEPAARPVDLTDLIALSDLPKHLPKRNGKKIHVYTLTRWRLSGKLLCVKIGSHYYVTRETLASLCQPGNPPPVQPRQRTSRWAREYLASRGL